MRKFLFFCLLSMHFMVLAEPQEISLVAIQDDAPFAYIEKGESKGLLVEVLDKVAAKLPQYKITLTHLPWSNIRDRKFASPVDGFLGAYFRLGEWQDAYPYSYPLYHEQMCIVCSGTNPLGEKHDGLRAVVWPRDYANTRLGTVRNYSGWLNYGEQARVLGSVNVFEFPNPKIALKGIYAGTVECALFEKTIFRSLIKNMVDNGELPKDHGLRISTELVRDSLHIAYFENAMTKEKLQFVKDFDAAFAGLLFNNELSVVFDKYGVTH